jgi:hypothetical protein
VIISVYGSGGGQVKRTCPPDKPASSLRLYGLAGQGDSIFYIYNSFFSSQEKKKRYRTCPPCPTQTILSSDINASDGGQVPFDLSAKKERKKRVKPVGINAHGWRTGPPEVSAFLRDLSATKEREKSALHQSESILTGGGQVPLTRPPDKKIR